MLTIVPTIDTEGFHGPEPFEQFILGEISGSREEWGVFRISDICRRNGVSATFFVDVYESVFWGEAKFRDLTRRLLDAGSDVQLHTHPEFRGPRGEGPREPVCVRILGAPQGKRGADRLRGPMAQLSFEHQLAFLKAGMDMLKAWTGVAPVAHRSGGYSINADTIEALKAAGIALDSSMNIAHPNAQITWSRNAVVAKEGLVELPVTVQDYVLKLPGLGDIYRRAAKTDINTCSLAELVAFVDFAVKNGLVLMNLFMHSYSLLRFDRATSRSEPRADDAQKLDRFLALMRKRNDVRVMDCAQVLDRYRKAPDEFVGFDVVPELNAAPFILRHGVAKLRRNAA
jgi:peptidoglycan/xylan/chitin deacetylase (PgdA/CDA1 family)